MSNVSKGFLALPFAPPPLSAAPAPAPFSRCPFVCGCLWIVGMSLLITQHLCCGNAKLYNNDIKLQLCVCAPSMCVCVCECFSPSQAKPSRNCPCDKHQEHTNKERYMHVDVEVDVDVSMAM